MFCFAQSRSCDDTPENCFIQISSLYSRVHVRKFIKKQKGKFPRDLHIQAKEVYSRLFFQSSLQLPYCFLTGVLVIVAFVVFKAPLYPSTRIRRILKSLIFICTYFYTDSCGLGFKPLRGAVLKRCGFGNLFYWFRVNESRFVFKNIRVMWKGPEWATTTQKLPDGNSVCQN